MSQCGLTRKYLYYFVRELARSPVPEWARSGPPKLRTFLHRVNASRRPISRDLDIKSVNAARFRSNSNRLI